MFAPIDSALDCALLAGHLFRFFGKAIFLWGARPHGRLCA
jgi:hypothetical protein